MGNYGKDLLVWDEQLHSVGKEDFDTHHRVIFDLINEMCEFQDQEQFNIEFRNILTRSIEYFKFHLKQEEEWLAKINYPDYREHCNFHKEYILNISKFYISFTQNKFPDINKFIQYQKEWWFNHICIEDMKYKSF